MKIGKLVQDHIKQILFHCDTVDHNELLLLLDRGYSKRTFGINYSFCKELTHIDPNHSHRYWREVYTVRNKQVRITNDWYAPSTPLFMKYLDSKQIVTKLDSRDAANYVDQTSITQRTPPLSRRNSRYRGYAIGNAQNYFIRNILSNLGYESFSEQDWNATKAYFADRCAYCSSTIAPLVIDHAVPINKESLGEHRLGNLVPSCTLCNNNKAGRDFRTFLEGNLAAIQRIEAYMESRNYVPLADNEQMKNILRLAHTEIAALAIRYSTIINDLFPQDRDFGSNDTFRMEDGEIYY